MDKIDFSYLVEKVEEFHLTEARKWTAMEMVSKQFNLDFDKVGKIMKAGGPLIIDEDQLEFYTHGVFKNELDNVQKNADGTYTMNVPGIKQTFLANRKLRYFILITLGDGVENLSDLDLDIENYPSSTKEVLDKVYKKEISDSSESHAIELCKRFWKEYYPEGTVDSSWRRWVGPEGQSFSDPDKLYRSTLIAFIKNNPEILQSEVYQDGITDLQKIYNYVANDRVIDYQRTSVRAAENLQNTFNMTPTTYSAIIQKVSPFIKQLKQLNSLKRNKSTDTDQPTSPEPEDPNSVGNDYVDNVLAILNAVEAVQEYKEEVLQSAQSYNLNVSSVWEVMSDEIGVDPQLIEAYYKASAAIDSLLDGIKRRYEPHKELGLPYDDLVENLRSIEKYLTGPTGPYLKIALKAVESEFEQIVNIYNQDLPYTPEPTSKFPGFDDKIIKRVLNTPEKQKYFSMYYNRIYVPELIAKVQKLRSEKFTASLMNQAIDAFDKYMDQKNSEIPNQEEDEETLNGVMSYMTEQVEKDKKFGKTKGKFVDRGFRKPINYAHWIHINNR